MIGRPAWTRAAVLDRLDERLGLHHHARPAAIRYIVHAAVPIRRVVAQIVHRDVEQSLLDSAADHALRHAGADHPRKNRDEVEFHF